MSKIFRYNNDFATINLPNGHYQRLLIYLVGKLGSKGLQPITLPFEKVSAIMEYGNYLRPYQIIAHLNSFKSSVDTINVLKLPRYLDNEQTGTLPLFSVFTIDKEYQTLTVAMNKYAVYLNNNLKTNYYAIDYSLVYKSTESAVRLYTLFASRRYIGKVSFSMDKLVEFLGVSKQTSPQRLQARFLDPALKIIRKDFRRLTVKGTGRARKRVYTFTWDTDYQADKKEYEVEQGNATIVVKDSPAQSASVQDGVMEFIMEGNTLR